jgi:glycerophosphoryl diester phosphodiesterase
MTTTWLEQLYATRTHPLIVGHRGAKADAPMNTLPAFELALAQGAVGVELDVWLTADNHVVVLHDAQVDATSDGRGAVQEMTLAQVQALDAGRWFGAAFAGARIPTLAQVLQTLGPRALVNVEIKTVDNSRAAPRPIVRAVAEVIAQADASEQVLLSSFNPQVLGECWALMPDLPRGFLYDTADALGDVDPADYQALHPHFSLIDADTARRYPDHWLNTWTVNEPADAQRLAAWGVAALITDGPARLLAHFANKA